MKKFSVRFHPDAEQDIASAYQWGCNAWGAARARQWLRDLRQTINRRLTTLPKSCPVAPESAELGQEVRQLVVQRYRLLFVINKNTVTILYLRGPYAESETTELE